MKSYKPEDVRVVGIFGHRGSGKTSLAEAFLYNAGVTKRLMSPAEGPLTLELDEIAMERQTTMAANVGFVEWNGTRIGVIDTPGDSNFWGSANRAVPVVDAGVITVSAPDGVEPITLRVMQRLQRRRAPFAIVVTKLDKDVADYDAAIAEIKTELATDAVAVSVPIGTGNDFRGVVSLLTQKAYVEVDDKTVEQDVPADLADHVALARELLFDAVAAADDDLAEKYLEDGSLTEEELATGLRAAFCKGVLVPIMCGAPSRNIGARMMLDVIATVFPSPRDRPAIKGYKSSSATEPVERLPDPDGPLVVQIFRTFNDPFAGTLSYGRVWAGTLQAGEVLNATHGTSDRPSHIYLPQGGTKGGVEIKQASVGDLVVLTKLKSTHTGDTLAYKDEPTFLPRFEEPDALLNFGLRAVEQKDEDKLSTYVHRLVAEDPSLRFERDEETKELLLGGLGQIHIDHVVERLKKAGVSIELKEPKVPYRETIRVAVKGIEGKHKKQSGGHGQYGVCFINVEPLPRGSGVEFVDAIVGGAIPRNYIPSVERGIRDALHKGPLSGNEVVDLKITLYDGKYHRVDSSDMAFQVAGRKAIREVFKSPRAKPVLLEPYMELDIQCPAENVGDVMGDLNSRRARVNHMTTEGKRGKISAAVPMNEILRYTNVLKSITSGRGSFHMHFDRYEEAPPNVQDQVTAAHVRPDDED
ncbi:MAG TPA: elongation factor G [Kofleriaceae bacterium]|nr:elongation factor G [Kofleriaceae bacterium]